MSERVRGRRAGGGGGGRGAPSCPCSPPPRPVQVWSKPATTFDNLYEATISLLRIILNARWTNVMWNGMDVQGIDECLRENASKVRWGACPPPPYPLPHTEALCQPPP